MFLPISAPDFFLDAQYLEDREDACWLWTKRHSWVFLSRTKWNAKRNTKRYIQPITTKLNFFTGVNNPNLFAGTERSDVICANCKNVSTRSEDFYHISLDWPESLKRGLFEPPIVVSKHVMTWIVATEDHPKNSSYEPVHEKLTSCLERYPNNQHVVTLANPS